MHLLVPTDRHGEHGEPTDIGVFLPIPLPTATHVRSGLRTLRIL